MGKNIKLPLLLHSAYSESVHRRRVCSAGMGRRALTVCHRCQSKVHASRAVDNAVVKRCKFASFSRMQHIAQRFWPAESLLCFCNVSNFKFSCKHSGINHNQGAMGALNRWTSRDADASCCWHPPLPDDGSTSWSSMKCQKTAVSFRRHGAAFWAISRSFVTTCCFANLLPVWHRRLPFHDFPITTYF